MDIGKRIVDIIVQAQSPTGALHAAAEAIIEDQGAQACGVFLRTRSDRLVLWFRHGEGLGERVRPAAQTLVADALARVLPAFKEAVARTLLAVPLAMHGRPIGALVVERAGGRPYSGDEISRLSAVASQIVGVIASARLLEELEGATTKAALDFDVFEPLQTEREGERVLRGTAAAPGIAIGAAVFRNAFPRDRVPRETASSLPHAEHARFRDALQKTRNDLMRLQSVTASELGEDEALIFGSHLMLLSDPMIHERIERGIANGRSAAAALEDALDDVLRRLHSVPDTFLHDRAEDIEDLRSRILGHMLGDARAGQLSTQLVVSPSMAPSLVMELRARGALGIASELGGTTSHGVLLARALNIPAVTGVAGLLEQVVAGEPLIIDGDEGLLVLRPSAQTLARYERRRETRERMRTEFLAYRDRTPMTADGVRFALQANVALGVDLQVARDNGAEGIGLYRTEFPFIVRDGVPTLDEQVRIYARAHHAFPSSPVWFRLLDLAGDKLVSANVVGIAHSAFHGYRSIRVLFDYPHLLRDQVQALAIAAGERSLWLLVPMVTSVEDIRHVKELVAAALASHPQTAALPPPRFGAVIEVPAAVEIVAELAQEVDFFSIGTNDLIQYTLVVDRDDSRLSSPRHAFHPAILRMVRRVVHAAHAAGKEVGVCGEAASQPEFAVALLALGVDVLSVTPPAIPELKQRLARVPLRPLVAKIDAILGSATAPELESALRAYVDEHALPDDSIESKANPSS